METSRLELIRAKDMVILRGKRRVAIDEFSLHQGDRLLIRGANGSGKSTLCLAIAGLLKPTAGEISRSPALSSLRLGYLPQSGGLYPHLTVAQNISFFRQMFGHQEIFDPRLLPFLWKLGLGEVLAVPAQALSGGYFRLAALACVLAIDADALLLDEPLAGLDEQRRQAARTVIGEAAGKLQFLVVTAHRGDDLGVCDRVVTIGRAAA